MRKGDTAMEWRERLFRCRELLEQLRPWNWKEIQLFLNIASSPTATGKGEALLRAERLLEKEAFCQRTRPPKTRWTQFDAADSIVLGYSIDGNREIRVPLSVLAMHLFVYAPTGGGKTTFLFNLIVQLVMAGVRVIFPDYKDEGRRLLRSVPNAVVIPIEHLPINFLEPVGNLDTFARSLMQALAATLHLDYRYIGPGESLLLRTLETCRSQNAPWPSIRDFAKIARREGKRTRQKALIALAVHLEEFASGLGPPAHIRKGADLSGFDVVVFERRGFPERFRRFLSAHDMIREKGAALKSSSRSVLAAVILADEALFEAKSQRSSSDSPQATVFREALTTLRSFGIAYWMAVQSLAVDDVAKSNTATFLSLGCNDPKEAKEAAGLLGLPLEQADRILKLKRGEFLIRSNCCEQPAMGTFPRFDAGDYLSDSDLADRMAPVWARLKSQCEIAPTPYESRAPVDLKGIFEEENPSASKVAEEPSEYSASASSPFDEWLPLLQHIVDHPECGIGEHLDLSGYSRGRGIRIKNLLLREGLITSATKSSKKGGRPREILSLSERGLKFLKREGGTCGNS